MNEEKVQTESVPTDGSSTNEEKPADAEAQKQESHELFPGASNWYSAGSSWFNSAKQKTMDTIVMVQKDLSEFKDVMATEVNELSHAAKEGLDNTVSAVKQQAEYIEKLVTPEEENVDISTETSQSKPESTHTEKKEEHEKVEKTSSLNFGWMKSIVDTVTDTVKNLGMEETYEGEGEFTEAIKPHVERRTKLSTEKLHSIQTSESTFVKKPEDSESFDAWLKRFNMSEYDGEINLLLSNNPPLRQLYSKLVPSTVDSMTFWSRYFYTVEIAELDEEMNESFKLQQLTITTEGKGLKEKSTEKSNDSPSSETSSLAIVEQPTSPAKSDEWSVCSEKEVEEVVSTQSEEETGPLTPRAEDDSKSDEKKEEGWVDWDE